MGLPDLARAIDDRLESLISAERAAHSRRVASLAASLCSREGLDPWRGRVAGLAHDMCKELPRKAQAELARGYAGRGGEGSTMDDKIVHGPAAAALLAEEYGVEDAELLEAVAIHTVGKPGMGSLAAILYCADKLEPGRERIEEAYGASCLALPLDGMLLAVVEGVVRWLKERGRPIAPETIILYSSLTREADPR